MLPDRVLRRGPCPATGSRPPAGAWLLLGVASSSRVVSSAEPPSPAGFPPCGRLPVSGYLPGGSPGRIEPGSSSGVFCSRSLSFPDVSSPGAPSSRAPFVPGCPFVPGAPSSRAPLVPGCPLVPDGPSSGGSLRPGGLLVPAVPSSRFPGAVPVPGGVHRALRAGPSDPGVARCGGDGPGTRDSSRAAASSRAVFSPGRPPPPECPPWRLLVPVASSSPAGLLLRGDSPSRLSESSVQSRLGLPC
jgi:hypothetical protein